GQPVCSWAGTCGCSTLGGGPSLLFRALHRFLSACWWSAASSQHTTMRSVPPRVGTTTLERTLDSSRTSARSSRGANCGGVVRFGPLKDPSRTSLEVRSLLNFMRIARDAHTPDLRCRAAVALNSATQT